MAEDLPSDQDSRATRRRDLAQKLDAAGWGLFFIWVGAALLLDVGWGVGLIGVAAITLGEQVVRWYCGLGVQGFWLVAGLLFLAGGVWELFQVELSLVPMLLIAAGVALLVSLFGRGRQTDQ